MTASIISALGLILILIIAAVALLIGLVVRAVRRRTPGSGGRPPPTV
jgi:hypothetical protein